MIEIADYDPEWPVVFEALRDRYRRALNDVPVVGIEHVGSTSVPGLAAKPVIDVDIVVPTAGHVRAAITALELIGFRSVGDLGIADRWALDAPTSLPRTNTYVVVEGSLALRNHLGVREELRNDEALRAEYATVKRSIAERGVDVDEYVEAKSAFLIGVLERAGLTADERKLVLDSNRRDRGPDRPQM